MKITKYGHACLLVEDNGKRLLIDPGSFTFNDSFLPSTIGKVDVIVITHHHPDHLAPSVLRQFQDMAPVTIIGGSEIVTDLAKENIVAQALASGSAEFSGFAIQAFLAEHEPMPGHAAQNYAYYINSRLLHPGDSYVTTGLPQPEILALPTQGPWSRVVDAIAYGKALQPKVALAIHNSLLKPDLSAYFDGLIAQGLAEAGVEMKQLAPGESWED